MDEIGGDKTRKEKMLEKKVEQEMANKKRDRRSCTI